MFSLIVFSLTAIAALLLCLNYTTKEGTAGNAVVSYLVNVTL